jgi:FAD/FMN-containing dehydrogenase
VRPADTAEVSAVVRACADQSVAVVTQGGNTGLVGGATPAAQRPQIVLSMRRLDALGEADPALMQLPCGAGVTLARLQRAAADAGLQAGLDLAARDSATVGGLAACNAGGLQAVRYGTARRRIAGLEVVLADGSVVRRMAGLRKDNAGYDLMSLVIGSEGTLGVVTQVLWSMVPRFSDRALALVAVDSVGEAVAGARALLPRLSSLELLELIDEQSIRLALQHLSSAPPAPITPAWILVRESLTEAIAAAGIPHKLDVGVPLAALESFLDQLPAVVAAAAPGARTFVYGHLGDGNLHVNLLGPPPDDESADGAVLQLAARSGGTITAEHGVGRHKPQYLSLVRSDAEIAAMWAVKRALDPEGTLNPGVILA